MAYHQMAYVYDELMQDAPYDDFFDFTIALLREHGTSSGRVADLGCGTGEMTIRLAKAGYRMYGIDYSEDMLAAAAQKAADERTSVQWIHQDLRELDGLQQLDAAVSYFDVMNYITEPKDLENVFARIASALKPGGSFLFDVHSVHHLTEELAGETFAYVTEDLSYIWLSEAGDQEGEVYHDLTFFLRSGEMYDRFDEYHHQRTLPIADYEKLLFEAGFNKIIWYGGPHPKFEKSDQHADRIFFFAIK